MEGHDQKMEGHGTKMEGHDTKMEGHDTKMEGHGTKMEGHDQKMEGHDQKMEGHDQKMEGHDQKTEGHGQKTEGHDPKMEGHVPKLAVQTGNDEPNRRANTRITIFTGKWLIISIKRVNPFTVHDKIHNAAASGAAWKSLFFLSHFWVHHFEHPTRWAGIWQTSVKKFSQSSCLSVLLYYFCGLNNNL
jgi:hypothetical protein